MSGGEWTVGSKRASCAVDGCDHTPRSWIVATHPEMGELELALVCFLHAGIKLQQYQELVQ